MALILNLIRYSRSDSPFSPFDYSAPTREKVVRAAILLQILENNTGELLLARLLTPTQINWGRGPTCPSTFVLIRPETRELAPLPDNPQLEKDIPNLKDGAKVPEPLFWNPFTFWHIPKCVLCNENDADIFFNCKCEGPNCCEKCILPGPFRSGITGCPICHCQIELDKWASVINSKWSRKYPEETSAEDPISFTDPIATRTRSQSKGMDKKK
jgi:hypothetical protein